MLPDIFHKLFVMLNEKWQLATVTVPCCRHLLCHSSFLVAITPLPYLRSNPLIPCPTLAGILVKFSHLSSKPTKLLRSKSFDMSATDRYIQTKITLLRNVFPLCSVQSRLVPQVWIELGGRSSIIRVIIAVTYHSPCPLTHTLVTFNLLEFLASPSVTRCNLNTRHTKFCTFHVVCHRRWQHYWRRYFFSKPIGGDKSMFREIMSEIGN
jgi:hypothetical protein